MKYDATRNPPLRPPVPRQYKRTAFPTAPINTFKTPSEQKRRAGDHARMPGRSRKPTAEKKGRKLPAKKVCTPGPRRRRYSPDRRKPQHTREMLPTGQETDERKARSISEPGRGGDPRNAGAPQQARISPAKREDARRLAPCGELRTRYTTCDSDTRRHTGQGGVRGS